MSCMLNAFRKLCVCIVQYSVYLILCKRKDNGIFCYFYILVVYKAYKKELWILSPLALDMYFETCLKENIMKII